MLAELAEGSRKRSITPYTLARPGRFVVAAQPAHVYGSSTHGQAIAFVPYAVRRVREFGHRQARGSRA